MALTEACHVDIETYSESGLKQEGLYRYAEHPSTEITILTYKFNDDLPIAWVPLADWELPDELVGRIQEELVDAGRVSEFIFSPDIPMDLAAWIRKGKQLRAHNAAFERANMNGVAGRKLGIPPSEIKQWVCTAAKAAAHSLPRALENCARETGVECQKKETGRYVMLKLSKPRKASKNDDRTRWTPDMVPDDYFELYDYNIDDVYAEHSIDEYIPELPKREQQAWEMDQRINDRGIMIDPEAINNLLYLIEEYKEELAARCRKITGLNPSQTEKLANWIRTRGAYDIENLQAPTIKKAVKDKNCPKRTKRVLRIRSLYNMKAVSKYKAMLRAVCEDGRLHGMFLYHGANTGRWSSMIVQLQNLFRPVINDPDLAIEACELRSMEWIKMLYSEDPMRVFSSCVRGMLVAKPDHDILAMDYSSIEGRVTAWLADDQEKLEIYRTHGKIYEYTAAGIFGFSTDIDFLKEMKKYYPSERFAGKTAELACGYQGSYRALMKMAVKLGIELEEFFAKDVVRGWRESNPKTVALWYDLEENAKEAVIYPGKEYAISKLRFKVIGDFLYMRLPSGRRIAYYKPEISDAGDLTYMGIDTYTRRWCRVKTYGGRLTENAASGTARDILLRGMFKLEQADYPLVGSVHDEAITEVRKGFGSLKEAAALMCDQLAWVEDLPIAAEGFREHRYRK